MRKQAHTCGKALALLTTLCMAACATPGCAGKAESDGPQADAGDSDAHGAQGDAAPPGDVSQLGNQGFIIVGIGTDSVLLVRGGEKRSLWGIRAQHFDSYLFALEFGWSWQASKIAINAEGCAWRDDDGKPSGLGTSSGVVTLDGRTSPATTEAGATLGAIASKLKAEMVAEHKLDAESILGAVGLAVMSRAHGLAQCTLQSYYTEETEDAYDSVVLVGAESEIESWWNALASLRPEA
jgi:hypothetical protein